MRFSLPNWRQAIALGKRPIKLYSGPVIGSASLTSVGAFLTASSHRSRASSNK